MRKSEGLNHRQLVVCYGGVLCNGADSESQDKVARPEVVVIRLDDAAECGH